MLSFLRKIFNKEIEEENNNKSPIKPYMGDFKYKGKRCVKDEITNVISSGNLEFVQYNESVYIVYYNGKPISIENNKPITKLIDSISLINKIRKEIRDFCKDKESVYSHEFIRGITSLLEHEEKLYERVNYFNKYNISNYFNVKEGCFSLEDFLYEIFSYKFKIERDCGAGGYFVYYKDTKTFLYVNTDEAFFDEISYLTLKNLKKNTKND